jgi:hypothetical protein
MGTIKPKVERSYFSEGLLRLLNGLGWECNLKGGEGYKYAFHKKANI